MKHITFRRWFPGQSKPDKSATFQVETNDDKINMVKFIVDEIDGIDNERFHLWRNNAHYDLQCSISSGRFPVEAGFASVSK